MSATRVAPLLALVVFAAVSPASAADMPPSAGPGVRILAPMTIPGLGRERTVRLYLPPGYASSGRRYPVLYMHDAQNLFDDATSYVGEWGVDEALDTLAKDGLELIVVGIDHGGEKRFNELSYWSNPQFGPGEGEQYTDFIVDVVKPHIDAAYRTKPGREHTGIMGSSMGGVASHYAIYAHPDVFSKAGIFSPAYWTGPAINAWTAERALPADARLWLNMGEKEGGDMSVPFAPMVAQLRASGLGPDRLHADVVPGAEHNEAFWRGEFPAAIRFLFGAPAVAAGDRGTR